MGTIKDRNGRDLTEAEEIKKRQQEYIEELYKKGLNDQDNHSGVVTHLEPDILECKVRQAMNKASGGDRITAELFKIPKDDVSKCYTKYATKFGKLNNGHRTEKGQFSL